MISHDKIIEIFKSLDYFMQEFDLILYNNIISNGFTIKKVIENLEDQIVK